MNTRVLANLIFSKLARNKPAMSRDEWSSEVDVIESVLIEEGIEQLFEDFSASKSYHEYKMMKADRDAWREALQTLTPVGSEFTTPEECRNWLIDRLNYPRRIARLEEDLKAEEQRGDLHADLNRRAALALGKPFSGDNSSWHDIPEQIEDLQRRIRRSLSEAVDSVCLDKDISEYKTSMWRIVQFLGGDEVINLLQKNLWEAYRKYGSSADKF